MTKSRIALALGLILVAGRLALAQPVLGSPVDGSTPPALAQGAPAGSYALSGFETVNLFNGGLNFRLPLAGLKGRGAGAIPLALALERKWVVQVADSNGAYIRYAVPADGTSGGVSFGPGYLTFRETGRNVYSGCTSGVPAMYQETLTRATFTLGDGTEMEFIDAKTGGAVFSNSYSIGGLGGEVITCPATAPGDRGRVWVTRDGSAATLITDTPVTDSTGYYNAAPVPVGGGPNAYIFTKDGTRYKFVNGLLSQVRDRNGNLTEYTYTSARLTSMRDSIGRMINIQYDIVPPNLPTNQLVRYDLIQYPSSNGGTQSVKVHYCRLDPAAVAKTCLNYTGVTSRTYADLFGLNGSAVDKYNPHVVSFVELPDGRKYQFRYNEFGELTRVTLPTGGGFGYEWDAGVGTGNGLTNPISSNNPYVYRRVKKRTVYSNGNTVEGQTAYVNTETNSGCPAQSPDWCTVVSVQQQNAASVTKQEEKHYFYGGAGHPDSYFDYNWYSRPFEGREYKVEQLRVPQGTVASATESIWEQRTCLAAEVCPTSIGVFRGSAVDPRLRKTTTTLFETNKVSSVETALFDRYNNPLQIDETGFDGAYRRKVIQYFDTSTTSISYRRPLGSNGVVNETAPDPARTVHLRSLVTQESTQSLQTPTGEVARVDYEYDVHTGGLPRHDARTGISSAYWDPSIPNERGNATQIKQHLFALAPTIPQSKELLTNLLYDDAGNVVKLVDPRGKVTTVTYAPGNGYAWPTTVTNALAHSVQTAYDFNTGFPVSFTDANSKTTLYQRAGDPLDRLVSASLPDGGQVEFKYCDAGSTVACPTDIAMTANSFRKIVRQNSCGASNNVVTDGTYDGLGRGFREVAYEAGAAKIIKDTEYDFAGRAYRVSNPTRGAAGSEWTETQFDSLGRPIRIVMPDGSATVLEPFGHQSTMTDPSLKKTLQVKDAFGRITSVTEDPSGSSAFTTNYRYSALDDLLGVCQGAAFTGSACGSGGRGRSFSYDSLRRLAVATNPESNAIQYGYDDAGNITSRTDANQVTVTTVYDDLNRPFARSYSGNPAAAPTVNYVWDTVFKGKLTNVNNGWSKTEFLSYDPVGRPLSSRQTTNSQVYDFSYIYNAAGALEKETYPTTRSVTTCYDGAGRISTVKQRATPASAETSVASVSSYAPHGAPVTIAVGQHSANASLPVVTETAQFNARLQPTLMAAGAWQVSLYYCPNGNAVCNTNNGNILRQTSPGGVLADYDYDAMNRLKTVTEKVNSNENWRQKFKYDPFGNRAIINDSQTLIPNVMATPRVAAETDPMPFTAQNRWVGALYDLAGNQLTSWDTGMAVGAAKYSYDGENRLKKAEVQWTPTNSGVMEYGYDGDGRRVTRSVGGVVKTTWVYDAMGQLAVEYGESAPMPCTTCYLSADHLGSTRVVWDSTGAIQRLYDYAPFGEEVPAVLRGGDARFPTLLYPRSGGQGVSMEFTGKERDAETGLDYFGARYMSAAQGRFTSPDPLLASGRPEDPQSWNRYAYTLNNPLRFIDPTGMKEISAEDCSRQPSCINVPLNIVLDQNANIYDRKGNLNADVQQRLDAMIAQAKDEYGSIGVHLEISYGSGTVSKDQIITSGASSTGINVGITDSNVLQTTAKPAMGEIYKGKTNIVIDIINAQTHSGTLGHEIAHHFNGETRSTAMAIANLALGIPNLILDGLNNHMRADMRGKPANSMINLPNRFEGQVPHPWRANAVLYSSPQRR